LEAEINKEITENKKSLEILEADLYKMKCPSCVQDPTHAPAAVPGDADDDAKPDEASGTKSDTFLMLKKFAM